MKKVVVSGGSGFVASWGLTEFLTHGYAVVTSLRSLAKADSIKQELHWNWLFRNKKIIGILLLVSRLSYDLLSLTICTKFYFYNLVWHKKHVGYVRNFPVLNK